MKKNYRKMLFLSLMLVFALVGCGDSSEPTPNYNYNNIMDTLKGEWLWTKTLGGFVQIDTNARCKCILKILGQNQDSTIIYETYVEDTLFKKGNFRINDPEAFLEGAITPVIIPIINEWPVPLTELHPLPFTQDTLILSDGAMDGFWYVYSKIK